MDDLKAIAEVGIDVPIETMVRHEALKRELADRVKADPAAVANFGLLMEQGRSMLDRQLRHALMLLAERGHHAEQLAARVAFLEGRLGQVERRYADRRWWWPW